MERIVTEWPEAGFLPIDIDAGFAHGSIKDEVYLFGSIGLEGGAIPPYPHIGQSTRTAGLHRGFFLKVLCHGHLLQIVIAIEGTIDSPIVRHTYYLPFRIIEVGGLGFRNVSFRKPPVLFEQHFGALLRLDGNRKQTAKDK